ncbi:MAG: hypothetical protein FWF09_04440 [Bacteroidales bacterium]|nr:hypothetical protein [Bacteroidales bacterium]
MEKSMSKLGICLFLLVLLSMTGCNKFKGDQEVPSYLRIDSITLVSAFGLTPTANISDAWITINGQSKGAFQLPMCVPILERGEQKVLIQAGILANNLSFRRTIYPFYSGIEFTVNFVEDSVINVTLKDDGTMRTAAVMRPTTRPLGNENFERGGHIHMFDTVPSYGSVPLMIRRSNSVSQNYPKVATPERLYEEWVGLIHLTQKDSCCCIMTKETCSKGTDAELPYNQQIFIEIDYLTNNRFEVGIVSTLNNKPMLHPVVVIGSSSEKDLEPQWRKAYVDISNAVTAQLADKADDFRIFIRAYLNDDNKENGKDAYIYLDNIRMVFAAKN